MANSYSDPLRPARLGRIDARVHPSPTYHGESLVPDYSKWMPGLADYDRLQRNRAAGVTVGQYGPASTRAPSANPAFPPPPAPAPAPPQPFMPPSINSGAHGLFPGAGALPAWPTPSVGSQFVPFAPASSPAQGPGPATPAPSPAGAAQNTPAPAPLAVAPPLPSYLLSRDNVGNARFTDGSRITTGADGSKTLLIRDGSGSATFGGRTQPSTIEHTPSSDWFVQQAQAHHAANAFANYDPQTGQASPRTGSSIGGLPSSVWFARQAKQSGQSNRYANYDPATGRATPVTPSAAPAATAAPNTAPAAAPADPDKKPPGTLQARAMKSPSYFHARSFTPEMLAKMDAASLAALALRPRAPELYRQWREDPASLPELKQENPSSAQAMAARALRPRFGPGASSATAIPLMRSGPRSAADLAKLDPATLAALALQPRAPQMRQQLQALKAASLSHGGGGLNSASFVGADDPNAKVADGIGTPGTPSPAFAQPPLPVPNFNTDPHYYLQPRASGPYAQKPDPQPNSQRFVPGGVVSDPSNLAGWHRNDISHSSQLPDISGHFKEMTPGDPAGWRSDPARTSLAPSTGVQLAPDGVLTPPGKKTETWANNTDPWRNLISSSDRKTDALDYYLHIKPPRNPLELEQARQDEISSSPTSAAYAAKLAQVAKDTGYTVSWGLNPNPDSHSSTTIPDHTHKQINISISQNDLAGGTFGHESDHAIRMMLEGQAMKDNPPPRHPSSPEYAAYKKGIKDKVASDPFFQNNSSQDSRDDAMENQGTRVGNLIIAERLAQQHMDDNGVPLTERAHLPNPDLVTSQRLGNNKVKFKHENNLLPLPPGTAYGSHVLDTLRQKWETEYRKLHPDR